MRCPGCTTCPVVVAVRTLRVGSTPVGHRQARTQAREQGQVPHHTRFVDRTWRVVVVVGCSKDKGWASWDSRHRIPWGIRRMKIGQALFPASRHTVDD